MVSLDAISRLHIPVTPDRCDRTSATRPVPQDQCHKTSATRPVPQDQCHKTSVTGPHRHIIFEILILSAGMARLTDVFISYTLHAWMHMHS